MGVTFKDTHTRHGQQVRLVSPKGGAGSLPRLIITTGVFFFIKKLLLCIKKLSILIKIN